MAERVSSALASATRDAIAPVAGLNTSPQQSEVPATGAPSMKWPSVRIGITLSRAIARGFSIVASRRAECALRASSVLPSFGCNQMPRARADARVHSITHSLRAAHSRCLEYDAGTALWQGSLL